MAPRALLVALLFSAGLTIALACSAQGPSGRIAFSGATESTFPHFFIFSINANGSGLEQLTGPGIYPAWSHDGTRLAFTKWNILSIPMLEGLYVMQADGSGMILVANGEAFEPSWSPDGRRIAFMGRSGRTYGIFTANADGSGVPTQIHTDGWEPAWSPDGARIAFVRINDGAEDIYVMNADGSAEQRLTNHPAYDNGPAWSPDGRRIAFGSNRSGAHDIYVMNADGSGVTRLTDNRADFVVQGCRGIQNAYYPPETRTADFGPTWSPDGRFIAYQSCDPDGDYLAVMKDDGSDQRRLHKLGPGTTYTAPSWAPAR